MDYLKEDIMEGQYISGGYWKVTLNGKVYGIHRLLWEAANGPVPDGYVVDHIDRNTLNNSLDNLRAIPKGANRANTVSSRSLPKGVYSRFAKRQGCEVYYGDIRMGGRKETHAPTKNLQEVVDWSKATHARLLEETYNVVNVD